jgi:hypothetical protein
MTHQIDPCYGFWKWLCHKLRDLKCKLGYHYHGHFYHAHGFCEYGIKYHIPYMCDNCGKILTWAINDRSTNTIYFKTLKAGE